MPNIELICVGTELLSDRVNTHINYIGSKLKSLGFEISIATTVPDEREKMIQIFKNSFERADMIIITGGLGPTFDDLTRECLATVLNEELIFSQEVMDRINEHFRKRGLPTPAFNERQAYIFKDSKIIHNNVGTAPGLIIERNNKALILLPGPPQELYPMFESEVIEYIKNKYPIEKIKHITTLHTFGLPESRIHEMIFDFIISYNDPDVKFSILPHDQIIDIKFELNKSPAEIGELSQKLINKFKDILTDVLYGIDDETLPSVVGKLLREKGKTLSVAESCTGGLIMDMLTNIPGSSNYFLQGIVAYSNESKINLLSVNEETLKNYGAVSEQVAIEMAKGIKKISGSDYAISTTGIAGPTGATQEKPIGLVYICVVGPESEIVKREIFTGTRLQIKQRSALTALDILRRELLR